VSRRNGHGRVLQTPRSAGTSLVKRRFIPLLGKRRTLEVLPVLTEAYAAYRGLKRSAKAIRELEEKFGFTNLYNLKGGILSYIDQIQPELTKY